MSCHSLSEKEELHVHTSSLCGMLFGIGCRHSPFLYRMLVLDYIMGNTDRHTNNFGLIRSPDTQEWMGLALIFDSGTS